MSKDIQPKTPEHSNKQVMLPDAPAKNSGKKECLIRPTIREVGENCELGADPQIRLKSALFSDLGISCMHQFQVLSADPRYLEDLEKTVLDFGSEFLFNILFIQKFQ